MRDSILRWSLLVCALMWVGLTLLWLVIEVLGHVFSGQSVVMSEILYKSMEMGLLLSMVVSIVWSLVEVYKSWKEV